MTFLKELFNKSHKFSPHPILQEILSCPREYLHFKPRLSCVSQLSFFLLYSTNAAFSVETNDKDSSTDDSSSVETNDRVLKILTN